MQEVREFGQRHGVAAVGAPAERGGGQARFQRPEESAALDGHLQARHRQRIRDTETVVVAAAEDGDVAGAERRGRSVAGDGPFRSVGKRILDAGGDRRREIAIDAPDAQGGCLSRHVGALDRIDPRLRRRHAHLREGGREGVVEEGDEAGTAAPVPVERGFLAAGRPLDLGCDVGDEIGVRAAEAVDGLLGVADPDARLGDPRHGDEDRELQGAGVLEFVDEDGFDALAQLEFEIGVAEKFQREAVLIDEVDEPPIPLVFLIGCAWPRRRRRTPRRCIV